MNVIDIIIKKNRNIILIEFFIVNTEKIVKNKEKIAATIGPLEPVCKDESNRNDAITININLIGNEYLFEKNNEKHIEIPIHIFLDRLLG